jgi:hypothetical protein
VVEKPAGEPCIKGAGDFPQKTGFKRGLPLKIVLLDFTLKFLGKICLIHKN